MKKDQKAVLKLVKLIQRYVQKISAIGPLFRDLKFKDRHTLRKNKTNVVGIKKQIKELPLYPRSQLLQTKLLKKIGGLEKMRPKDWVKEQPKSKLQQLFAKDPYQEYTEENERRLRKQIRQQIVKKKFRSLTVVSKQYQFIKPKPSYLHFLQAVPKTFVRRSSDRDEDWQQPSPTSAKVRRCGTQMPCYSLLIKQL